MIGLSGPSHSFLGKTRQPWLPLCLAAALLVFLTPSSLCAQAVTRINGTVTDQAGAAIPDAKVTVTNVDTNVSKTTMTTSAGTYLVTDLIPGTYTVKVEKTGFNAYVSKNVVVTGGETGTANATLTPGTVTETVEVTAPAVALQTEQPEIGTTITQALQQDLPNLISGDFRQIDSFIFLVPGVTGSAFSHRINGGVDEQTEVMFNGVPEAFSETAGFTSWNQPPYDSIKDVDILTGTFSAQYGLGQGVEQYNTKSGTNAFHGNAFFFYRDDKYMGAAGAFNDINPNCVGVVGEACPNIQNDWGFSLGGPVTLPKIYNGRNKTFFSIDKYRFGLGQSPVTLPTPAEVGGDFSALVNPSTGTPIPIFVPIAWASSPSLIPSGCVVPSTGPGSPGTQWTGNKIPTSCFSANSKALLGLIPKPTVPFSTPGSERLNFSPSYVPVQTDKDWMFNIDHNLTTKQALHFLYWRQYHYLPAGWTTSTLNNQTWNYEPAYGLEPRYSYAISPSLVMTAGVLWVHQNNDFYQTAPPPPSGSFNATQPGPYGGSFLPGINFGGGPWEPISWGTGGWQYSINHKYGISIMNNWLWQHGKHTINFGVDIRKTWQRDYECQQCAGNFSFDSETTADPNEPTTFGTSPGTNTGNGFASFLLGNADSANRQFAGDTRLSNTYVAPYFQDDTKITPKFTLNWGARWDLAFPFTNDNKYNQLSFFDASVPNTSAISTKTGQPLLGGMTELGTTSSKCTLCVGWSHMDMIWTHFSPRAGFTYQLTPKTVVLGGLSWYWLDTGAFEYGVNKTAVNYGNNLLGTVGFDALPNQVPGYGQWDGNPLVAPSAPPLTPGFLDTQFPHQMVRHVKQGYDELFTVGIQRELPWNMFLSVSGVHTHDLHLPSAVNPTNALNYSFVQNTCTQGPSEVFYQQCVLGQAWTSAAAQTLYQSAGFGQTTIAPGGCPAGSPFSGFSGGPYYAPYANFGCDYGGNGLALRGFLPFPMFRGIRNNFETNGADKYNALQMSFQKRTGSGLTFLVSYTLSRYLSNTNSGFSTFNTKGLNPANQAAEWSVGNSDQTHVLTMAGSYELPLGPGGKFLNKGGTLMRNVAGGWKLSMVNWYWSGTPFNITSCNGTFNCTPLAYTPQGNPPNFVSAGGFDVNWSAANYHPCTSMPCAAGTFAAFNPNKFTFPGAWTIGNAAPLYNDLRFPPYFDEDMSLSKKFFFGERYSGELGIEFFNVFNRMLPGACVDTNVGDSNFGLNTQPGVPCQGNGPRVGQASFKLNF